MDIEQAKKSGKQKILEEAIKLFAAKGFTETTMRELAAASGMKESSIYNHFSSKNAILDYIIDEYSQFTRPVLELDKLSALKDNPSADGIIACLSLVFPEGRVEYFLNELYVILHEQHRNPVVKKFMTEDYIMGNEKVVKSIINALIDYGVIRADTDPDFWAKMHSCLIYTFASRLMLGIGDSDPGFSGMGMSEMLHNMYELLLKTQGV